LISSHFKLFFILLAASAILSGCASTSEKFNSRDHVTDDAAVVFIFRPDALANAMTSPNVVLDGKTLFAISNKQFHTLQLPAGQHRIRLELPERYQGQHEVMLDTLNGQAYFLRIDTAVKFQQNRPYDRSFDLQSVTEADALKQITQCTPAVVKNPKPATEPAPSPTYSNQTFRNPFSR
jgi:Protein of unknown function (DUF2846)